MDYRQLVINEARRQGVDPRVALAIAGQESGFNPKATSPKNAQGLMQLIPATAKRFGVTDPYDPVQNVQGGIKYFRWLLDRYNGNVDLALAGYNAGEGAVDKHGGIPPYKETQNYVASINKRIGNMSPEELQQQYPGIIVDDWGGGGGGGGGLSPSVLAAMGILPQAQQSQPQGPMQQLLNNPLVTAGAAMLSANQPGVGVNQVVGTGIQAAQEAQRQQRMLEYEMAKSKGSGLPANIQELLILKQMYPHLSDEQIMSMAFTGTIRGPGSEFQKVGDRVYRVERNEFGVPNMQPLNEQEQADYERVIETQQQAGEVGKKFGAAQVDTLVNASEQYANVSTGLSQATDLLNRFKAGEFEGATGPVSGRFGQYFNPDTAQVQAMEMSEALANLGIENLAPVSNYEIDLIRRMYASSFSTPEQNIAILEDLVRVRKAKKAALRKALDRLKSESIEEYLQNPVSISMEDLRPQDAGPAAAPAPGGVPSYVDDFLKGGM